MEAGRLAGAAGASPLRPQRETLLPAGGSSPSRPHGTLQFTQLRLPFLGRRKLNYLLADGETEVAGDLDCPGRDTAEWQAGLGATRSAFPLHRAEAGIGGSWGSAGRMSWEGLQRWLVFGKIVMSPTPASSQAFNLTCLGKVRGQRQLQRGQPLWVGVGQRCGRRHISSTRTGCCVCGSPSPAAPEGSCRQRCAEAMLVAGPVNHSARPEALWPV